MSPANIVGALMVVAVFAGIFAIVAHENGVADALIVFGITVALIAWVFVASYLLTV